MFAVSGVSGVVGQRVARHLIDQGAEVRGIVRESRRTPDLPGVEVVVARYDHVASVRQALTGVDAVLMVPLVDGVERHADLQADFVAAAAQAGVEHLVYPSFLGADAASPHIWMQDHGETEDLLHDLGVTATILRTNFRADVLPQMAANGDIEGPAGSGRIAPVTLSDVAAVAAEVLLAGDQHRDRTFHLTGPDSLSLAEVAEIVAASEGRPVAYRQETPDETRRRMSSAGTPPALIELLVSAFEIVADGGFAEVTDDVEQILGRPARPAAQELTA